MTDTITYPTVTPRLALPLLFAGQSQKETTVNEALVLTDLLLNASVEGTLATPPATPLSGQAWIVGASPTGAFAGHARQIAAWTDGGWRFVTPFQGMIVQDRARNCAARYTTDWQYAVAPALPTGGTVVDSQARSTISALVTLLVSAGISSAA